MPVFGRRYRRPTRSYRKVRGRPFVAKKLRKYVKRAVVRSKEKKYMIFDTSTNVVPTSVGTGGLIWELTRIAQGNGRGDREANQLFMRGIKFHAILEQAAYTEQNILRLVIFQPKRPSDYLSRTFLAEYSKLLATGGSIAVQGLTGLLNNDKQCHVFCDKTWVMQKNFNDQTWSGRWLFNKYVKINRKIYYDDLGVAAGANEARNPIYVAWISDSTVVPNPGFLLGGFAKMTFTE